MFLAICRRDRDLTTFGFDALLPTIVRCAKHLALNKPGNTGGKPFDFARRRHNLESETSLQLARDLAVHTAKLVNIGDDMLANLSPIAAFHSYAARRQIDCRARAFKAVRQHVPTRQPQLGAFLLAPPFECYAQHQGMNSHSRNLQRLYARRIGRELGGSSVSLINQISSARRCVRVMVAQ